MIKKLDKNTMQSCSSWKALPRQGSTALVSTSSMAWLVAAWSSTDPMVSQPRHRFREVSNKGKGTTGSHLPIASPHTPPISLTEMLVHQSPRSPPAPPMLRSIPSCHRLRTTAKGLSICLRTAPALQADPKRPAAPSDLPEQLQTHGVLTVMTVPEVKTATLSPLVGGEIVDLHGNRSMHYSLKSSTPVTLQNSPEFDQKY